MKLSDEKYIYFGSYPIYDNQKTKSNTSDLSLKFIKKEMGTMIHITTIRDKWLFLEIVNTRIKMQLGVFAEINL